jgi:dipeptidyl aminopeptidase/acylaminoacyl peptidase
MTGPHSLLEDYFKLVLGDPEGDRDFLVERSPTTHIGDIACPLLIIQGRNDPRVVERESHDLLDELSGGWQRSRHLIFDDEGHDVLKLGNHFRCYDTITTFFPDRLTGS